MSDADAYLEALRRELPLGYRRRFVAEVREHFDSAVAAEAERGVDRPEAERLTIERLGPPEALAGQLAHDLHTGALGRAGRLSANLTISRLVAAAALVAVCVVAGVALVAGRSSRPAHQPERAASPSSPLSGVQPLQVRRRQLMDELRRLEFRLAGLPSTGSPVKLVFVPSRR